MIVKRSIDTFGIKKEFFKKYPRKKTKILLKKNKNSKKGYSYVPNLHDYTLDEITKIKLDIELKHGIPINHVVVSTRIGELINNKSFVLSFSMGINFYYNDDFNIDDMIFTTDSYELKNIDRFLKLEDILTEEYDS